MWETPPPQAPCWTQFVLCHSLFVKFNADFLDKGQRDDSLEGTEFGGLHSRAHWGTSESPLGHGRFSILIQGIEYRTRNQIFIFWVPIHRFSHMYVRNTWGGIACTLYAQRLILVLPYSLNIMGDPVICLALGTVSDLESVEVKQSTCVAQKQIPPHVAEGKEHMQTLASRWPWTGTHRQQSWGSAYSRILWWICL